MRVYANDRIGYQQTGLEAENIKVFKAAKLVNFMYMKQHMYTLDDIGELKVFPFVTDDVVETLMIERDEYHVAAAHVDPGYDLLKFGRKQDPSSNVVQRRDGPG